MNRFLLWMILCAVLFLSVTPAWAESKNVSLTTVDGYSLAAVLSRPEAGDGSLGVVLLHMYRNNKESWDPLVKEFDQLGLVSLAIDMRGHGQSSMGPNGDESIRVLQRDPALFNSMHLDAEAAVSFLINTVGCRKIALVGASVGCSVAIDSAVRGRVPLTALVVMTPGSNYLGVPTGEHIKKWPGLPLLILSSEEEKGRGAALIHEKLNKKGAELVVFPQKDIHGTHMFGEVEGVELRIGNWLMRKFEGK